MEHRTLEVYTCMHMQVFCVSNSAWPTCSRHSRGKSVLGQHGNAPWWKVHAVATWWNSAAPRFKVHPCAICAVGLRKLGVVVARLVRQNGRGLFAPISATSCHLAARVAAHARCSTATTSPTFTPPTIASPASPTVRRSPAVATLA